MTIRITLEELLTRCLSWDTVCEKKGFSEWAVREGGGDIEVTLTEEEALEFGIIFSRYIEGESREIY